MLLRNVGLWCGIFNWKWQVRRVLGIDLGEARVGVALSDDLGLLAHPLETIDVSRRDPCERIAELAREKGVEAIIVGDATQYGRLVWSGGAESTRVDRTPSSMRSLQSHPVGRTIDDCRSRTGAPRSRTKGQEAAIGHRPGGRADFTSKLDRFAAMRLRLIIAYDGRAYSGWQSQRSANTIQDILEKAFAEDRGKTHRRAWRGPHRRRRSRARPVRACRRFRDNEPRSNGSAR